MIVTFFTVVGGSFGDWDKTTLPINLTSAIMKLSEDGNAFFNLDSKWRR